MRALFRRFCKVMNPRRLVLAVALIAIAFAGFADEKPADRSADKVVPAESKNVCMINDRSMANEQIPVVIDGKTYYGCCPMCKERLTKEESSRFAIDPVSGKKVDKATAVIGALPGAAVLYFESLENFERYNAGARADSH
jgi:YHS domain-containing protein